MLLADRGNLATTPENDTLGSVTQLVVRFLTGQVAPYFEFYEFMRDRVLVGVPDYIPAGAADGGVRVRLAKFGELSEGVLNVSRVKTGRVTMCRLGSRGGGTACTSPRARQSRPGRGKRPAGPRRRPSCRASR